MARLKVTKETADFLMQENLSCSYRDVIEVKNKGKMTVYFVDLTTDLSVVELNDATSSENNAYVCVKRFSGLNDALACEIEYFHFIKTD